MNKAILTGSLGRDAKKTTAGNLTICTFSLGTSDNIKNKEGKWESQTEWHNIKTFGKLAEVVEKFHKGDQVEVSGKIHYANYKNQKGETVYTTEIVADSVVRKKKAEGNSNNQPQNRQYHNDTQNINPNELQEQEGDLPF